MKKIMMVLLSVFMIMGLVGCGNSERRTGQPSTEDNSSESSVSDEALGESSDTDDAESRKVSEIQSEGAAETLEVQTKEAGTPEIQSEEGENFESNKTRILVAYFSATNTTEGVAEHIANGLNADLYEIVPAEPYTEADLDYNDNHSRTTIEMDDADARPAISGSVEDMEQYDIVFIGYPIWWGEAPRIVSTFMESYDFNHKTIVPFCTSGGSGMGSSVTNLEQLTNGAEWLDGQRLSGNDSQDTVMEWVYSLGLDLGQ